MVYATHDSLSRLQITRIHNTLVILKTKQKDDKLILFFLRVCGFGVALSAEAEVR